MPIPVVYTKKSLIQRIVKHVTDSVHAPDEYAATDKQILLYIDSAAASRIVGQAYNGAKIDGNLVVPEAYYTTFTLPEIQQDPLSQEWFTTLPQPPLSLPLGYSLTRIYFVDATFGISQDVALIKSNRVSRRKNMPIQTGIRGWVEGSTLWLAASDGAPLDGKTARVQMASARTTDVNATMNIPEDDIQFIFETVTKQLIQRYGMPKDIIEDNLTAGNKSS